MRTSTAICAGAVGRHAWGDSGFEGVLQKARGDDSRNGSLVRCNTAKHCDPLNFPVAAPLQLDHTETNQKVHNEHRAPRAIPQGTESAQMRTQKLRLTFSTDTHIYILLKLRPALPCRLSQS